MRVVESADALRLGRADRAIGGRVGVRRYRGLLRAAAVAPAARRDPAARRPSRHRRAVRRARVLDSAAPSESGRGIAVARREPAAARAHGRGRRRGGQGGELHQRGHHRVPARRGRLVLFPRDEHAAPGRAPGHRDGRPKSTWCSGRSASRCGERLDIDPGPGADAARPRHRVPHLRGGSRPELHAVSGPDPRAAPRVRSGRARRRRGRRRLYGAGLSTTR